MLHISPEITIYILTITFILGCYQYVPYKYSALQQ